MASHRRSFSSSSSSSSCSGASDYITSFRDYGLDFRPRPLLSSSIPALPDHHGHGQSNLPSHSSSRALVTAPVSQRGPRHESTRFIREDGVPEEYSSPPTRPGCARQDSEVWVHSSSPIQKEAPSLAIPPNIGLSALPKNSTLQSNQNPATLPSFDGANQPSSEVPQISSKRSSRQGRWWNRRGKGVKDVGCLSPLDIPQGDFPVSPISEVFHAPSAIERYTSKASQTSQFFDDDNDASDVERGELRPPESPFGFYQSKSVSDLTLTIPEKQRDSRPSKPRLLLLTKPLRKVSKGNTPVPQQSPAVDISPWESEISAEIQQTALNSRQLGIPVIERQGGTGQTAAHTKVHRRETSPTIALRSSLSVTDLRSPTSSYEGFSPAGVPPSRGEQHRYHYTKASPLPEAGDHVINDRPISTVTKASSDSATTDNVPSQRAAIQSLGSEIGSGSGRSTGGSHEDRQSFDTTRTTVSNVFVKPKGPQKKSRLAFVEKALLTMSGGAAHYVPDLPAGRKGPGAGPSASMAHAM